VAGDFFEFDTDEKYMKKAAEGNLLITVTNLSKKRKGVTKSVSSYVSKDTERIHKHIVRDYIQIDNPQDGTEYTRLTSHQFEDNFLRHIYRTIEALTRNLKK